MKDEDIAKFDSKTEAIREKTAIVTSQFTHVTHEVVPLNNGNLVSLSSQVHGLVFSFRYRIQGVA